jgi:Glycosyl hydrolase family 12
MVRDGAENSGSQWHRVQKGKPLRKPMFCAVVLMTSSLAACTATTAAVTTTGAIPTHQCTSSNYRSSSYQASSAYGSEYRVENDVWNPVQISQTLYSCDFDSFYVEANVQNRGGAVQSYPSSQYTFASPVDISKFASLTSDFRILSPPAGPGLDYEFAYDIWINGYGGSNHTEMMIWTYVDGQRPAGSEIPGTISIDGHEFEVWVDVTGGDLVVFEAINNYTAGSTNLLPFFDYAAAHGWLRNGMSTPLWQIDYGAELCATPTTTKFQFADFNVTFKT